MHVEWYGQCSFALRENGTTVFIDPFGDMSAAAERGIQLEYPPITGVDADLVLVTHEHRPIRPAPRAGGRARSVDLLFIPVGGGPTIGATAAVDFAHRLKARWVVPMPYRTHRISFLETAEEFIRLMPHVERFELPSFETVSLAGAGGGDGADDGGPVAVVPAAP